MKNYVKEYFDYKTFAVVIVLIAIGFISIYSATFNAGASEIFHKQILWFLVGFMGMAIVLFLPLRALQSLTLPLYMFSLLILLVVLAHGKTVAGSTSWLGFLGIGGQPSELTKVTTILCLALYLSKPTTDIESPKGLLITTAIVMLPVALVVLQPDMGTAVTFLGMFLPILFWAGASLFTTIALVAPIVVAAASLFGTTTFLFAVVAVFIVLYLLKRDWFTSATVFSAAVLIGVSTQHIYRKLPLYQQKRIATFLSPDLEPLGWGYNLLQSKVAIGSGGLLGKGYLHGTQTQLRFIPAQWTDFIFCVPSEEFGFVGAMIVLILFLALLLHGVRGASTAKNTFSSLVAIGVTSLFAIHIFINIGMSLGLVPIIGIPLPFLSYGGSALFTNMLMAGLLMNCYANRKEY